MPLSHDESFRYGMLFALAVCVLDALVGKALTDGDVDVVSKAAEFLRSGIRCKHSTSAGDYRVTRDELTALMIVNYIFPPFKSSAEAEELVQGIAMMLEAGATSRLIVSDAERLVAGCVLFHALAQGSQVNSLE